MPLSTGQSSFPLLDSKSFAKDLPAGVKAKVLTLDALPAFLFEAAIVALIILSISLSINIKSFWRL